MWGGEFWHDFVMQLIQKCVLCKKEKMVFAHLQAMWECKSFVWSEWIMSSCFIILFTSSALHAIIGSAFLSSSPLLSFPVSFSHHFLPQVSHPIKEFYFLWTHSPHSTTFFLLIQTNQQLLLWEMWKKQLCPSFSVIVLFILYFFVCLMSTFCHEQ